MSKVSSDLSEQSACAQSVGFPHPAGLWGARFFQKQLRKSDSGFADLRDDPFRGLPCGDGALLPREKPEVALLAVRLVQLFVSDDAAIGHPVFGTKLALGDSDESLPRMGLWGDPSARDGLFRLLVLA